MICIWSISVDLTWGVASLRSIVLNMHMWASRVLKPQIQACVYQVSQLLKVTSACASPSPRASPSPCAPNSTHASPSADRLTPSRIRRRRATGIMPREDVEKPSVGMIDLTMAFRSSRVTDTCEQAKPNSQLSGSVVKPKESTILFRNATHKNAEKELFGGSPSDKSMNTSPYTPRIRLKRVQQLASQSRSNSTVEHDSDRKSMFSTPSRNFEVIATPPDSGTAFRVSGARVAFTGSKQPKVHQSPVGLSMYQQDKKRNVPSENPKDVGHIVEIDDSKSPTESTSESDDDECEHSDQDDSLCLEINSDHEDQSETSQDSANDTSDSDDDSDSDASGSDNYSTQRGSSKKYYIERMLRTLRSSHLSGERLMCWSTLEIIANALDAKHKRQACRLADVFRNSDGTCRVPLWRVLVLLEHSLEDELDSGRA
jgi:hypothetical protein